MSYINGLIDNNKIKFILDKDKIKYPKIWVDDKVVFIPNAIEKSNIFQRGSWNIATNNWYSQFKDEKEFTVVEKYLHNNEGNFPWWSLVRAKNGKTTYVIDDIIKHNIPDYRSRRKRQNGN